MNDSIDPSLEEHIRERLFKYIPEEFSEPVTQYLEKQDASILDFTDPDTGMFISFDTIKELLRKKGIDSTGISEHLSPPSKPDQPKKSDDSLKILTHIKEDMKKLGEQIASIEQIVQNQQP